MLSSTAAAVARPLASGPVIQGKFPHLVLAISPRREEGEVEKEDLEDGWAIPNQAPVPNIWGNLDDKDPVRSSTTALVA